MSEFPSVTGLRIHRRATTAVAVVAVVAVAEARELRLRPRTSTKAHLEISSHQPVPSPMTTEHLSKVELPKDRKAPVDHLGPQDRKDPLDRPLQGHNRRRHPRQTAHLLASSGILRTATSSIDALTSGAMVTTPFSTSIVQEGLFSTSESQFVTGLIKHHLATRVRPRVDHSFRRRPKVPRQKHPNKLLRALPNPRLK